MKKVIIALLLILSLSLCTHASGTPIRDEADLLTDLEEQKLTEIAREIMAVHDTDIVILTVDSIGTTPPEVFAGDYFDRQGLGRGDTDSGVLFLISMELRDWYILTNGYANDCVSDSDLGYIEDAMLGNLSDGEYYDAFRTTLLGIEEALADGPDEPEWISGFLTALLIGAAAGGISLWIMRRKMNTVRNQRSASNYMTDGSYDLYRCQDFFLYSRVTKVRKQENNSSGGGRSGGGRRSHGGGGGSRGGRGGKF